MGNDTSKAGGHTAPQRHTAGNPSKSSRTPVFLNVYEPSVGSRGLPGFSIYHTGIELFGTEYVFAGTVGVYTQPPRVNPDKQWAYKQSVTVGSISLSKQEVKLRIATLMVQFPGHSYNLTSRNCNHFTEAVCKDLGFSFPSWVNRAAKFGNAIKSLVGAAGMSDSGKANIERQKLVDGNISASIDVEKVGCLNASKDHPVGNLPSIYQKPSHKSKKGTRFLESDSDDQLLLMLPFKQKVKLSSLILVLNYDHEREFVPSEVRLFKNQKDLDFSDAEDAKPTEMFTLDEHFLAQSVSRTSSKDSLLSCKIPLKFVRWQDTFSLTIFITGSQGGDYVRLHDIQIFGQGFLAP